MKTRISPTMHLLIFLIASVFFSKGIYAESFLLKQPIANSPSYLYNYIDCPEYDYPENPHISPEVWHLVKPYLLPSNHPIKRNLDALFGQKRVTQNLRSLEEAHFTRCYIRGYSKLVVTEHSMIRGYWLKLFIDDQDISDFPAFINRIEGALAIQDAIIGHGYEKHFVVPKKWIYPLPAEPSPSPGSFRKNFILVAEDMDLYKKSDNRKKWATKITPPRALAIYTIMQELGLNDCIHPFNLPFSKDGRQAFIDTEHHHNWPVRFDLMLQHMPPLLQDYWLKIIETHGHP